MIASLASHWHKLYVSFVKQTPCPYNKRFTQKLRTLRNLFPCDKWSEWIFTTGWSDRINGSDGHLNSKRQHNRVLLKDIGQTQLAQPPQTTGALMNARWWFQKISLIGPGSLWKWSNWAIVIFYMFFKWAKTPPSRIDVLQFLFGWFQFYINLWKTIRAFHLLFGAKPAFLQLQRWLRRKPISPISPCQVVSLQHHLPCVVRFCTQETVLSFWAEGWNTGRWESLTEQAKSVDDTKNI